MIALQEKPLSSVNRRPTLDAVPAAAPVFSAFTASTTSATFTAWLSPVTEAVTYSGTASLYGIIFNNNGVNFVDPSGLSIGKKLYRVYKFVSGRKRLVGQVNEISNAKATKEVARHLREIDTAGGAKRTVEAGGAEARDVLAGRLSPDGKLRGPTEKSPGYPEHVHPNEGEFTDVHVEAKGGAAGAAIGTLGSIFTPYTEAATRNPGGMKPKVAIGAMAWDLASTIDPFFITDAIEWLAGVPDPEEVAAQYREEVAAQYRKDK